MRASLAVAFVLVLAACASAQPRKPENQPQPTQGQPANDPRGTNESPFVVKIQPTTKTDEETAKEQAQEQAEAASKRVTENLAFLTAGVALLQLVGLGFQVWIARRQNQIIENQSAILKEQEASMKSGLTIARDSADASKVSADAAKEAADTAAQALLMAHRPSLIVRHVVVEGILRDGTLSDKLTNGFIWVTNVGVLEATLLHKHAQWFYGATLPIKNPALEALDHSTIATVFPPSGSSRVTIPDREIATEEFIVINNLVQGVGRGFGDPDHGILFLIGYLKYRDAIGLRRQYFAYEYNTKLHYFTPVDHPSYYYSD